MAKPKRRRGHGEGSIYQRGDGRWAASVELGYSADGKRRRKTVYGATRKEVAEKLKQLQRELDANSMIDVSDKPLAQYLAHWLEQIEGLRRGNSYGNYERSIRLHIAPEIGHIPLGRLTGLHIQRLYTTKAQEGYAPNTIRVMHAALGLALGQAVKWRLIPANPALDAQVPRIPRAEMAFLTPEEITTFLKSLRGNRDGAMLKAAVMTGLRLGEITGLQWTDVDLEAGELTVNHTLHCKTGDVYILGEPKTPASRRKVPIPPFLIDTLKAHRREQMKEQLRSGGNWRNELNLVFTRPDGRPYTPKAATWALRRALKAVPELPTIRFHDLRHTYATLHLTKGTHVKIVSSLLGHSNVGITLDLYSHLVPGIEKEAVAQLDDFLGLKAQQSPG